MRKLYSLIILLSLSYFSQAQNDLSNFCASKSAEEIIRDDKTLSESQKKSLLNTYKKQQELVRANSEKRIYSNLKSGVLYVIPVVFHILHNNGPENISDAQVRDQLRIMNQEFQKLNTKINGVVAPFKSRSADIQIEYRLATIVPTALFATWILAQISNHLTKLTRLNRNIFGLVKTTLIVW